MIGSRSDVEEKLNLVSQPFQTLLICLSNHLRQPSAAWAERIDDLHLEIESALRNVLGPDTPARVKLSKRHKPLSGSDLTDTIHEIRQAQKITETCFAVWLKSPTKSARERVARAVAAEDDLFALILEPLPPRRRSRAEMAGRRPDGEDSKALNR
jgi:hypothetical protein